MTRAVRFVRRYSVGGAAFMRFERSTDGARVDVKVKSGYGDVDRYTRREARIVAEDRLAGSPATWVVACDDYATDPATLADAERVASEIAELAASGHRMACYGAHVLRSGKLEIAC